MIFFSLHLPFMTGWAEQGLPNVILTSYNLSKYSEIRSPCSQLTQTNRQLLQQVRHAFPNHRQIINA